MMSHFYFNKCQHMLNLCPLSNLLPFLHNLASLAVYVNNSHSYNRYLIFKRKCLVMYCLTFTKIQFNVSFLPDGMIT